MSTGARSGGPNSAANDLVLQKVKYNRRIFETGADSQPLPPGLSSWNCFNQYEL